jgi:serine phosphatase RsbU (regulator of sigma subunit)
VDNEWVDGKVKQRVLLRLGRLDELLASGRLDALMQSLGRFSEKLAVLGAHARGESIATRSARIGPALIFQLLWQACSIDKVMTSLLKDRRFEFSIERAIFLTRQRSRRRKVEGRLCHRRRRRVESAPSLPSHGLAGRSSAARPADGGDAIRAPNQ